MSLKHLMALGAGALVIAGCQSGDINLSPSTNVTDSNNTVNEGGGGNADDVCASYVNDSGQKIQGSYDGTNCTYSPAFADAGKNLLVDMTIPALPDGGAHIFEGSLFVGKNYGSIAEANADGIFKGGDGPTLTVEAGAIVAFTSEKQFLIINRGSQLFAVGRSDAPITFTGVSDVNGTVGPEDVQQWGGIVINGFGITNKCAYTGSIAGGDLALAGDCSVDAEGAAGLDQSQYGGDNNDDSSGRLEYVIAKHTGATVGNGDELNGISWGAVGRNTIVKNVEMYSTYDDGMEFFGGAVNVENYLAVYVRDDSIDIDEGYSGTITNALVIQSETDGNSCIESDGIGDFGNLTAQQIADVIAQGINSRPTINNLTCIISPSYPGTHDPGAGWRFREGIFPTVNDSMIVGSWAANDATSDNDNYCLRIDDDPTQQAALDGDLQLNSVIFACAERTHGQTFFDGTTTEESFATAEGAIFQNVPDAEVRDPTAAADTAFQVLEGSPPVYSIDYATSVVNDTSPPGAGSTPTTGTFLGGLSLSQTDWTQPWAYGLDPNNRGEDLWFE